MRRILRRPLVLLATLARSVVAALVAGYVYVDQVSRVSASVLDGNATISDAPTCRGCVTWTPATYSWRDYGHVGLLAVVLVALVAAVAIAVIVVLAIRALIPEDHPDDPQVIGRP